MAFLNVPLKSIQGTINSVIGTDTMAWYNPISFPVQPGDPQPLPIYKDYRWRVTMSVDNQSQSAYNTRAPGAYNGLDINVGQWIASLTTGQAWQIITIEAKDSNSVTLIVQDIYRYNTFRDPSGAGNGAPNTGTYVVFTIGDTGVPEIDPVPPGGVSSTFGINIQSRFQYINLQYDYPLYQANHTFAYNDTIAADPINHKFVLSDSANRLVIGRITSVSDTVGGWFTIDPVQKIVDNINYLPGDIGDVIYSSLDNPGEITTLPGGTELYIKLRNHTQSISHSLSDGPTIAGSTFQLNSVDVVVGGTGSIANTVSAVNLVTTSTGVTASTVLVSTTVETNNALITSTYGEPALWATTSPATATINGILVTFNITSGDPGYSDYARAADMAASINAANIPNVIASAPTPLVLLLTHLTGGSITIINITPDINGVHFAGPNSGSGIVLITAASTTYVIKFLAQDARPINFLDVIGTPVSDFGLVSVENGIKACGLYIEEGLRTASLTVVTGTTQMTALKPLIGDQAYVIDSNDGYGNNVGEWSLWLYNGSTWIRTSNQDSASTDAKSLEYTVTIGSPSSVDIGEISTGRRVTLITVEVSEAFNGPATLSLGYRVNNPLTPETSLSGLMGSGLIDLSILDTFTTSTDVLFGTDTPLGDVTITASFNNGTSTDGVAQIIVSYV